MKTYLTGDYTNVVQILKLPTQTGFEIIDTRTIVRIEALSNYSKLFFRNGGTLVVAKVLRWFEEYLGTAHFIRLHRTHLVNKKLICTYTSCERAQVKLVNGDRIAVSRRKRSHFLKSWKGLIPVNTEFT
jgi:two-component system, LytTR family, response regulator